MPQKPSHWDSAQLFLRITVKHGRLAVSGAVASLAGWILYALGITSVPWWIFQVIAAVLILMAMIRAFHDVRLDRDEARSVVATEDAKRAVRTALGNSAMSFGFMQQEAFEHQKPAHEIHQRIKELSEQTIEFVAQHFDGGEVALFNPTTALALDEAGQKVKDDGFKEHAKLYMMACHHAQRLHSLIERFGPPTLGR